MRGILLRLLSHIVMLALASQTLAFAPAVPALQMRAARSGLTMGVGDLPGVSAETGYKVWDPLGLSDNMDEANLKVKFPTG